MFVVLLNKTRGSEMKLAIIPQGSRSVASSGMMAVEKRMSKVTTIGID